MKLLSLEIGEQFRSLHPGFQVHFHKLTDKGVESMLEFQPFCFAGLNGSGKSNVLEALAAIFYHLEMCVAKYRPKSFEKHFDREKCLPDEFVLKYLISKRESKVKGPESAFFVRIEKSFGVEPKMFVEASPTANRIVQSLREVSLKSSARSQESAPGKEFLPDLVVGYSSGENEILSLPFIKNRLIHFDEYKEAVKNGYSFVEPETSLIYIDQEMSQAVLLTAMIFEDPNTTLKTLKDELGIQMIQSFRMNLNYQSLVYFIESKDPSTLMSLDAARRTVPIFLQFENEISKLKDCATCWYFDDSDDIPVLSLDFLVDENLKKAIRENYNYSPFEFFRTLQVLYELNNNIVSNETKEEVYKSEGFYTDWKLPTAEPSTRVFHFLDFMIVKETDNDGTTKELLLRELSDGEHQFLHSMGICLILKDRHALLLMDEPETHFNPGWRAKFIKVLNESLKAGDTNNFLKDVILTSHSPFIISDCLPNNVIFFSKGKETHKLEAKTARELDFNTYGTSVEIILDELFEYNQSIGDWANEILRKIDFEKIKTREDKEVVKQELKILGESIEKDLILAKLNRIIPDQPDRPMKKTWYKKYFFGLVFKRLQSIFKFLSDYVKTV